MAELDNNWYLRQLWERSREKRDGASDADKVIAFPHHEIHEGHAYRTDLPVSSATSFDTNDVLLMAFNTPNSNKIVHMVVLAVATGAVTLQLFEDATVTATTPVGNAVMTIFNRNRNCPNMSDMTDTYSGVLGQITGSETGVGNGPPTVSDNGTTLFTERLGAGSPKAGGENRDITEWNLKSNSTYVAKVTANAENITAHLSLIWYEHVTIHD